MYCTRRKRATQAPDRGARVFRNAERTAGVTNWRILQEMRCLHTSLMGRAIRRPKTHAFRTSKLSPRRVRQTIQRMESRSWIVAGADEGTASLEEYASL